MLNGFFRGLRRALAVAGLAASAALPAMAQQLPHPKASRQIDTMGVAGADMGPLRRKRQALMPGLIEMPQGPLSC